MTHWAMSAVAREVIEAYGDASGWAVDHPVGTGPYVIKEWKKGSKVILGASPTFREVTFAGSDDPEDRTVVAAMKGKRIPAIGRVEINIIEESNPRFLAFDSKQLDFVYVPSDFVNRVISDGKLKPEYARQGIQWLRVVAWQLGGIASVREGESFINHLYSKRIGVSNYGNFRLPEYDKIFEAAQLLPDGPERNKLYRKLADYHFTYAPAVLGVFRYSNLLLHPWVQGWKPHSFLQYPFWQLDIDTPKLPASR